MSQAENAKTCSSVVNYLVGVLCATSVGAFVTVNRHSENRMYVAYERITPGMHLYDVEQLLGSSLKIGINEVPVIPSGPVEQGQRVLHRVVEGEAFYVWRGKGGREVIVAFVGGRGDDKFYREWDL